MLLVFTSLSGLPNQSRQPTPRVWHVALMFYFHWNKETITQHIATVNDTGWTRMSWSLPHSKKKTNQPVTMSSLSSIHLFMSRSFIQMHFPLLACTAKARSHMCGRRLADGMCPISLTQHNETRLRFSDLQLLLMAKDRKPTHSKGIFPLFKDNEITMYSMYH